MKRLKLFLLLLCLSCLVKAQVANQNYIRTRTMQNEEGICYVDDISYYDGLGRPFQTVRKPIQKGEVAGSILATLQEYDAVSRTANSWLPIVIASDYITPVDFKSTAPGKYDNDSCPYSTPVYETSPLQRILQQYGAGQDWHMNGKSVKTEFLTNTASGELSCRWYHTTDIPDKIEISISSDKVYYPTSELYITRTTYEDAAGVSLEFRNKLGQVLLARRKNGTGYCDTYYVYDTYGNLRAVLPPAAADALTITGSWTMATNNTDILSRYAYLYKYDDRSRCTGKKLPGIGWMRYEYDNIDRMICSQDAEQAAKTPSQCTFYLYDNFNRPVVQGLCDFNGPICHLGFSKMITSLAYSTDGYIAAQGIDDSGYSPNMSLYSPVAHTVNYYDNYSFMKLTGFTNLPTDGSRFSGNGLLTGTVTALLDGSGGKLYTVYYYDEKGRLEKTVSSNHLGGYDKTTTVYTFTGKSSTVTHVHTSTGKNTWTEVYTYTYDYADRISKVQHTLGGTTITLYNAMYDDLDRLKTKSLHGSATNMLTYTYNLRGWLTGITGTRLIQNLYYNTGVGTAKYNGNISSMTWKAGNESTVRGYKFTYDGLDRLLNGTYGEGDQLNSNPNRYSEKVTGYDKNGNITGLERYGRSGYFSYGMCDALTYTLNGNQVTRVDDQVPTGAGNDETDFKDIVKQANEYTYDANGNLTKDLNKGITGITYNCLNLPNVVTFSDGSTVTYTYSADSTKLRTVHKIGSTTTTTDYCGNVIYENNIAKLLLTGEGYVSLSDKKYHYYLQDLLGNNRVVVDKDGNVEETNHYYPFGGVFASTGNVQPYKYNGKELDAKKGLNWYDYGARMYDPTLGRWHTVDPLAEKFYGITPYNYCFDNPIKYIDPDGKKPRVYVEMKGVGHTFITTGEGKYTTVYTYGRYGGLNTDKSSFRSLSRKGEGVLIIMKGNDAINYIKNEVMGKEARTYEITNGNDEKIDAHFNEMFNSSDVKPSEGKYENTDNAKVIDTYDLWDNNCTTKSVEAVKIGTDGKLDLNSSSPSNIDTKLYYQNKKKDGQVERIDIQRLNEEYKLY
ncbi:RHS repeat domain-containing protein [Bacteroides stercorirosoris]|uniref:RHS repeat-associated core domain-containing protein n=1 Tax=Bacteroides stercorirosoris TaxID=871324 RepID=A0A1M6KRZ5_9BACE|nr:RHS repeat-associated core domain-containing protein [Bacteroides stercorirosoris]SHJ61743.1 RHS repeat-associated core domain-containing protein [Bacteroides stercorirosoris]